MTSTQSPATIWFNGNAERVPAVFLMFIMSASTRFIVFLITSKMSQNGFAVNFFLNQQLT